RRSPWAVSGGRGPALRPRAVAPSGGAAPGVRPVPAAGAALRRPGPLTGRGRARPAPWPRTLRRAHSGRPGSFGAPASALTSNAGVSAPSGREGAITVARTTSPSCVTDTDDPDGRYGAATACASSPLAAARAALPAASTARTFKPAVATAHTERASTITTAGSTAASSAVTKPCWRASAPPRRPHPDARGARRGCRPPAPRSPRRSTPTPPEPQTAPG